MIRLALLAIMTGLVYWYGFDHARIVLNAQELTDFQKAEYDTHNLNGKDGWSDVWNTLLIEDGVRYADKRSIRNPHEVAGLAYKELDPQFIENGVLSFFVKIENNTFSDDQSLVGIFKGVGEEFVGLVKFSNNFNDTKDTLLLSRAGSTESIVVGKVEQGFWHKVSLGWRTEDYALRIKLDDGAWSEWIPSQTTWGHETPFGVRVSLPDASTYGDFYINSLFAFSGVEDIALPKKESLPPELEESISLDNVSQTSQVVTEEADIVSSEVVKVEETPLSPEEVTSVLSQFDQALSGEISTISSSPEDIKPTPAPEIQEEKGILGTLLDMILPTSSDESAPPSPEEAPAPVSVPEVLTPEPQAVDLTPTVTDTLEASSGASVTTEF